MKFECPRSCPKYENRDECRFNTVFAKLGAGVVTSHTTTIKSEFKDYDILAGAVKGMGGSILGMGTHSLFSGQTATGFGFRLPNWQFPLVATADGSLAFDDYHGNWGNVADLERLKVEYVISTAEQAAMSQGWMTERVGEALTIHHPSGGSLTVTANGAEANGFMGVGCHEALMSLNLPMDQWTAKPELGQVACEIRQGT
jgi:hypothetical protein